MSRPVVPLPFLSTFNLLQAGAMLALMEVFGLDALRRKDRVVGRLAIAAMLLMLRHGVVAFEYAFPSPTVVEHLQASLTALGFMAAVLALWRAFQPYFWGGTPVMAGGFLLANLARALLLPLGTPLEVWVHAVILAGYPLFYGVMLLALLRAFRANDPLSRRLLIGGFLLALLPLLGEGFCLVALNRRIPMSGLAMLLMAVPFGVSRYWVIGHRYEEQLQVCQAQRNGWRRLISGPTWCVGEPSSVMESLFGEDWSLRLQERMPGRDGRLYRLHRVDWKEGGSLGWLERLDADSGDHERFLNGWAVAVGVEEPRRSQRIEDWLRRWGAEVVQWGAVPPREGPFPSLILWDQEASILRVWREYDLERRRCRWIQIGGAPGAGPHIHLKAPLEETSLREALESLLVFRQ
jgi:hypothetical protein